MTPAGGQGGRFACRWQEQKRYVTINNQHDVQRAMMNIMERVVGTLAVEQHQQGCRAKDLPGVGRNKKDK